MELHHSLFRHQALKDKKCGNVLRNHSSPGYSVHSHSKAYYKEQIQNHIDRSGGKEEIKRPPGISYCSEDRSAEVIKH